MLSKNEKMFLTRNSDAERWMLLMTRRPSATTPGSAAKSESSSTSCATWLAACRCQGVSAASAFYGRRITELNGETPKVPIILHFGKADASIPMERVEEIREAHPETPIYLYDAGHGFVSARRADSDADSARLARLRTLALFANNGGGRSSA